MNAISNSHMTAQQHAKLARHYQCRYQAMMRVRNRTLSQHFDYTAMFHKMMFHKRAVETLRAIEAQQRTESGLLALGTVAPVVPANPAPIIKLVEANVTAGHTYYRHGDTPDTAFTVLSINPERQRNSICVYRVAQVRYADGTEAEYKLSGNQRYVEVL